MQPPLKIISQFTRLERAIIDASSIIYAEKAGFLNILCDALNIYCLPEILTEAGNPIIRVKLIHSHTNHKSNDEKLIQTAIEMQFPLISEDKKCLMRMKREKLDYYNALMVLNYLYFRQLINEQEYFDYHTQMQSFARYTKEVWEFGHAVYKAICEGVDVPLR